MILEIILASGIFSLIIIIIIISSRKKKVKDEFGESYY